MSRTSSERILLLAAAIVFIGAILVGAAGYRIAQDRLGLNTGLEPVTCGGHPYSINVTSVRLTYYTVETTYLEGGESITQPLGPVIFVTANSDCRNGTLIVYYYTMQTGIRPAFIDLKNSPQSFYVLLPRDVLADKTYFNETSAASTLEGVWKTVDMSIVSPQQLQDLNGNTYNITLMFKYDNNTGVLVEAQRSLTLSKVVEATNGTIAKSIISMKLAGIDFASGANNTYSYTSVVKAYIGSVYAAAALVAAGLIGFAYLWGVSLEGLRPE